MSNTPKIKRNRTVRDRQVKRLIAEADGEPTCFVCREPIHVDLKYPHPFSVSLEHVNPLSKGGSLGDENTALSHLTCNKRRNDRPDYRHGEAPRRSKGSYGTRSTRWTPGPQVPLRRSHALVRPAEIWESEYHNGVITAAELTERLDVVDGVRSDKLTRDQYRIEMTRLDDKYLK